jgi:hypothetical protein
MTSSADADVGMEAIANGRATITPAIIRFITKSPLLNYFRLSQQTFIKEGGKGRQCGLGVSPSGASAVKGKKGKGEELKHA